MDQQKESKDKMVIGTYVNLKIYIYMLRSKQETWNHVTCNNDMYLLLYSSTDPTSKTLSHLLILNRRISYVFKKAHTFVFYYQNCHSFHMFCSLLSLVLECCAFVKLSMDGTLSSASLLSPKFVNFLSLR